MGADATVRIEAAGPEHVALVRITRPEARNALDAATRQGIIDALHNAVRGGSRAIVLTGTGASFAAGADLKEMAARTHEAQVRYISVPRLYEAVESLPAPVIAAINGHALGAGLELALACDLRIAAAGAKLGSPEVRLGIIPGGGATQRLPRVVGLGHAMRMVLTGEPVLAEEALRIGLVEEVVAPDALEKRAVDIAGLMARWSPIALAAGKRALRMSWNAHLAKGLVQETVLFGQIFGSRDAREGIAAFLEKRDAKFEGR